MRKIIASLDIGSNSIKLMVGEYIKNNLHILCVSEVQSKGIKKGLIFNKEEAYQCLKEVFQKSESILGVPIREVVLAIPSYFLESFISEGVIHITSDDHVITHQDLVHALHEASYHKVEEDCELLSVLPTTYKINDDEVVKNPIHMIANQLSVKAVLITAPKSMIMDFVKILERLHVKVASIVPSSLCDYALNKRKEVLNKVGAVINIGEETTTVSILNKGILVRAEIIELGGINIDNDIAYIYKITKNDARDLKENVGLASVELAKSEEKVHLTDRLGEEVYINQRDLSEIIESRLEEILELSKKQINLLTKKEIDYIIITGGTSEIRDFHILLDKVFTKTHYLGKIDYIGARNNKYSTCIGAIIYFNSQLRLKNKDYSVFSIEDLEILSGNHKKTSMNENSILGKLFGYFFDN